jgi:hypothetical protein
MKVPDEILKTIKTPAGLEGKLVKEYGLKAGDFMFVEWSALKEDALVTSERSAFISIGICKLISSICHFGMELLFF